MCIRVAEKILFGLTQMTQLASTRFLHVANGTSTTRLIAAAGIPGTLSIWADPLHDGPVPGGVSDDELLAIRMRHLSGGDDVQDIDPVRDLRRWRAAIDEHASYEELVLWFEHDVFDQLNLIQLLTWIHTRLPCTTVVSLVCIGSFPDHPRFKGLGELSPDDIASLLETREQVREGQYALAARAWDAFRAPTPEPLDDLRRRDTSALPYLGRGMHRFLQEYPWTTDGLCRTERRLLQLAGEGPVELVVAFPRMHESEDAYYVSDASLVDLAASLSRTSPPLLTLTPGPSGVHGLQASVAVTDFGRAVLAAQADRVQTCGVDRWLGGVHLDGHGPLWRWDDAAQRVVWA